MNFCWKGALLGIMPDCRPTVSQQVHQLRAAHSSRTMHHLPCYQGQSSFEMVISPHGRTPPSKIGQGGKACPVYVYVPSCLLEVSLRIFRPNFASLVRGSWSNQGIFLFTAREDSAIQCYALKSAQLRKLVPHMHMSLPGYAPEPGEPRPWTFPIGSWKAPQ